MRATVKRVLRIVRHHDINERGPIRGGKGREETHRSGENRIHYRQESKARS